MNDEMEVPILHSIYIGQNTVNLSILVLQITNWECCILRRSACKSKHRPLPQILTPSQLWETRRKECLFQMQPHWGCPYINKLKDTLWFQVAFNDAAHYKEDITASERLFFSLPFIPKALFQASILQGV